MAGSYTIGVNGSLINVTIFMWRAELDRLPTKLALRRRSINVEDMGCSLCGEGVETVDHLFTACSVSCGVWSVVSNWCKVPQIFAFTFNDLLELRSNISGTIAKKEGVLWRGDHCLLEDLEGAQQ
ncbi:uncharacterized protein LOC110901418 [Helianthus annuus]|uniref:uncharacterized protein LOC110901418 n=1 Tax=Helianthus annuus TaxID=4232 RepID=UPI000B907312|nr:uncharacterized protein LOC110901418 [Helianthus annuus]